MKLFANPASTCTRKVLTALAETNTPYELVVVDFATGEHKSPEHMARQPFGQVPALNDGGFALYESRAICRYINEKAQGNLVPNSLKDKALMEQWISVEMSNFTPHAMKFIYNYIFQRAQDEATMKAAEAGLSQTLSVLDRQLAKSHFLVGNTFTLADIGYLPYIEYIMPTPAKSLFTPHQNVMGWWQRCSERPSWRKAAGR